MLDKRLLVTGAAVLMVAMATVVAVRLPAQTQTTPSRGDLSNVPLESSGQMSSQPEYSYLIKAHQGRIAVYTPGGEEPEMVLDVFVKYLPDYDRDQMEQGIPVDSYSELVKLLEDYAS